MAKALEDLGLPLSVSSRLLPEYREYERTSTTAVNAYVSPIMSRYLGRLDGRAGPSPSTSWPRTVARSRWSGPSGSRSTPFFRGRPEGWWGPWPGRRRSGFDQIITFDMGGTSTDVSLCPGRPLHTREFEIAGQPVAVPVIDIHTVGAGGGSLARVDAGGALRVGPESAGADPGPIAYG